MKLNKIDKELFVNSEHSEDFDNADLMIFSAEEGYAFTIVSPPRYEPVSNTLHIKIDVKKYIQEYLANGGEI
jgi:hypothetical protein